MLQHDLQRVIIVILLCLFVTQCGGGGGSSSSTSSLTSGGSGNTTDDVVGGNVSALTVSSESGSVSFDDLADDDDIMLVLYSYNPNSTTEAFQIGSSENSRSLIDGDLSEDEEASTDEEDVTEEFHMMLRDLEENLEPNQTMAEGVSVSTSTRFLTTGVSTRTFKVLNSFSSSTSYDTVTATLRYQSDYFNFYVGNDDASSLSDSDLESLAADYEAMIPDERNLFGNESDVDSDGKFNVLFTHTVNGLASGSGGIVTGFFYAIDLLSSDDYPLSNETEVFYSFVPDPTGTYGAAISKSFSMSNILPGVLVHEYQHMINFNQHYFINGGSAEQGFLNEGLSHLAEDIYTLEDGYMADHGNENPARVAGYLDNISNVCFTCGSSLNQRGGSYLFLRYLYEQAELGYLDGAASGGELIHNLLDTNERGVSNIVAAANGVSASDDTFKTLLGEFGLAVYLSNTDLSDNPQLGFTGIDLRGAQNDNRGTTLNGPAVQTVTSFPFTDTLQGNGISFIQISGSTINDNGGTLPLSFAAGSDFGAYIVR